MTHQQPDGGPLGPYAISLIRTVVPLAWGYAVAWLIHLGLPATFLAAHQDLIVTALGALATAAWYALWRWAELKVPRLDSWLARLVVVFALGHPGAPVYAAIGPASQVDPAADPPTVVVAPVDPPPNVSATPVTGG
jgi:hypothetical protein